MSPQARPPRRLVVSAPPRRRRFERDDLLIPGMVVAVLLWAAMLDATVGLDVLARLLGWDL